MKETQIVLTHVLESSVIVERVPLTACHKNQ